MSSRFIHIVPCLRIFFLLKGCITFHIRKCQVSLSIHPLIEWVTFHLLALMNKVSINMTICGKFCISVKSIWCVVLFKSGGSLLILCLNILSIIEIGVLKCPSIIILMSFFSSVLSGFALYVYILYVWCRYIYNYYIVLLNWLFNHYIMTFFVFYDSFFLLCRGDFFQM